MYRIKDVVIYSPLTNQQKPFIFKKQRYNRDEIKAMGYDNEAHEAILSYLCSSLCTGDYVRNLYGGSYEE